MGSKKDTDKIIQEMIEQRELANEALKKLLNGIESKRTIPGKKKTRNRKQSEK